MNAAEKLSNRLNPPPNSKNKPGTITDQSILKNTRLLRDSTLTLGGQLAMLAMLVVGIGIGVKSVFGFRRDVLEIEVYEVLGII